MAGDFNNPYIGHDDNNSENDEALDQQQEAEQQEMMQAQKRAVENSVKTLPGKVRRKFFPWYTAQEKRLIKQAQSMKVGAQHIQAANMAMEGVKTSFASKLKILGIILAVVAVIGMLFMAIIAGLTVLESMFPWLFPKKDGEKDKGMSSQFGADYTNFYGNRVVYKDIELSRTELLNEYNSIIVDIVTDIEDTEIEGATLDVTISIPTESNAEYFATVDMTAYETDYAAHYSLLKSIADTIHSFDKENQEIAPTNLIETLDNIGHFGLSTGMIDPVADVIRTALNTEGVIDVVADDPDNEPSVDTITIVDTAISERLNETVAKQTEKLFIRDYIFTEDNQKMADIAKENYVSMTFMAKNAVSFKYFSFMVSGVTENFTIEVVKDNQNVLFSKEEYMKVEGEDTIWLYKSADSLNLACDAYANVGDLDLSSGKSLLEIANSSADSTKYLQNVEESEILTFNKSGVRVEFNESQPFMFSEYETKLN